MMLKMILWGLSYISMALCLPTTTKLPKVQAYMDDPAVQAYMDEPAVQLFREYVRIDTSLQENIPLAVEFWKREADNLGLPMTVHQPAGKPILVITWPGADTALPSIMLNSHMDVVPVEEEEWTHAPFLAEMDEEGNIYGRGTQDDKDVAIQYLEAIRRLRGQNITLQRTVHITLMPDEETGGYGGMQAFCDTEEFRKLNVAFALDEGMASDDDVMYATYQDKRPWQIKITVRGDSGHGSLLAGDSAINKLQKVLNTILEFRDSQLDLMSRKDVLDHGAYTSVNINLIHGGAVTNMKPTSMFLVADMRLANHVVPAQMEQLVNSWVSIAGEGTTLEFIRKEDESPATPVDGTNPYWLAMQEVARDMNATIKPLVIPATSDMLYLRNKGVPALGFATKTRTVARMHGHDEYLNAETFLRGIDLFVALINKLGNVKQSV